MVPSCTYVKLLTCYFGHFPWLVYIFVRSNNISRYLLSPPNSLVWIRYVTIFRIWYNIVFLFWCQNYNEYQCVWSLSLSSWCQHILIDIWSTMNQMRLRSSVKDTIWHSCFSYSLITHDRYAAHFLEIKSKYPCDDFIILQKWAWYAQAVWIWFINYHRDCYGH